MANRSTSNRNSSYRSTSSRGNSRKRRKKKRKGTKILFIFEVLVLVLLAGGVYLYSQISSKLGNIQSDNDLNLDNVQMSNEVVQSEVLKGYQNIMLVGVDSREGDLNYTNSDTMIIASINNDTKEVKLVSIYRDTYLNVGDGSYNKANHAYCVGGAEQMLSMVNTNLDLNISDYVTVDFKALSEVVDLLGGISITMTADEVVYMNDYCVETSEVTGKSYERLPEVDGTYTLNGVQAVSYARIRYTAGNDFKRAQRQRLVIDKIVATAKEASWGTLNNIMDTVFPMIKTSFSKADLIQMGTSMISYNIAETTGFPQVHYDEDIGELDAVIPVTLAHNVSLLHNFLFGEEGYQVSATCQSYSDQISADSGYSSEAIEGATSYSEEALPNTGSESDIR